MIARVTLRPSGLVTSRLAFGTSRLHHVDATTRQRLLAAALELGVVHFDTAPAYGDELAEREVGRFARSKRSEMIIATKYGIPADPVVVAAGGLAHAVRSARAVARRAGLWTLRRPAMTAAALRASVERSLRVLGIETVDCLFLHEPSLDRIAAPGDMLVELQALQARGLIRHFGVAGGWASLAPLLAAEPGLGQIVQTDEAHWSPDRVPDITYGAIAAGGQSGFAAKLEPLTAERRLAAALARRPSGVVIVSTTRSENLASLAAAASEAVP